MINILIGVLIGVSIGTLLIIDFALDIYIADKLNNKD